MFLDEKTINDKRIYDGFEKVCDDAVNFANEDEQMKMKSSYRLEASVRFVSRLYIR